MNLSFLKYLQLGFELFNAVTTLIMMIRVPALLDTDRVWEVVFPVLNEVAGIAKIKINLVLAKMICVNAVNTIKAALVKPLPLPITLQSLGQIKPGQAKSVTIIVNAIKPKGKVA